MTQMQWLPDYIYQTYGECKLDQCLCIKKDDNLRMSCKHWVAATAKTWNELLEQEKRKRNVK